MRIVTVVGARPQFIKASALSRELARRDGVEELIIHTGQHFDAAMSDVFFEELEIPEPFRNLGVHGLSHGAMTGRMLELIEQALRELSPDAVVVYGDTDSTLAGALAAAKLHIRLAHIEAGLRSLNRRMPEELNRILTDHAADLLFAPTETAMRHLASEGLGGRSHRVGDVMYDAALYFGDKAEGASRILERLNATRGQYVLATVHRAENTDDPQRLRSIMSGLEEVARSLPVLMPLHPRTRATFEKSEISVSGVTVTDPVGYLDMLMLERHASVIVTDSGGVQKEAYFYGVPCVTARDETEWTELLASGWNVLARPEEIQGRVLEARARGPVGTKRLAGGEIFGTGGAAALIADHLMGPAGGRHPSGRQVDVGAKT